MINRVHVRNFQSLHDVELELGPFTVIVGPSSSGKSALMRSLRTLTSNRRGAEFISHGERTAVISADTDRGIVTLTRSKAQADNAYKVTPNDPNHPLAPERTFLKLGGETPPEVSEFIGIASKDPINYAGQFDKPYLLDDSSSSVANTLGSLTNANIIFDAARESNRRKLQASSTLKTRLEDLNVIKAKIPAYRTLKARAAALTRAEEHIERARSIEKRLARLSAAGQTLAAATAAVEQHKAAASIVVPSMDALQRAAARQQKFTKALAALQQATAAVKSTRAAVAEEESSLQSLQEQRTGLIAELGGELHTWIITQADPSTHDGIRIEIAEAARVFALYLEQKQ